MKKLMIALVAVAMGVAANAASVAWTAAGVNPNADQMDVTKYMAYAIDASVFARDDVTEDTYMTAIRAATSSIGLQKTNATATTGKVPNGVKFTDGYSAGDTVSYYMLIIDNELGSETAFALSNLKTGQVTAQGGLALSFGSLTSVTGADAWTSVGGVTPEPTSALLLLLGVAGLALKRKQA